MCSDYTTQVIKWATTVWVNNNRCTSTGKHAQMSVHVEPWQMVSQSRRSAQGTDRMKRSRGCTHDGRRANASQNSYGGQMHFRAQNSCANVRSSVHVQHTTMDSLPNRHPSHAKTDALTMQGRKRNLAKAEHVKVQVYTSESKHTKKENKPTMEQNGNSYASQGGAVCGRVGGEMPCQKSE